MKIYRRKRYGLAREFSRTLSFTDFNLRNRRDDVADFKQGFIQGLQVDVPAAVVKAQLLEGVHKANAKIEDLIAKVEKDAIKASDVEDDMDDDSDERHSAKQNIRAAKRKIRGLRNVVVQAQFLADYVVDGATYRLDAEDARRLSVIDIGDV
jgi:hypothetical protein